MPTQPLIDRTNSAQALRGAIETFSAQVTADLEKLLRPLLKDGEELPDLAFLQELMGRVVDADLEEATKSATRSETRVASARIARKLAFERFNVHFPDLTHALVGLYQLSGHGELAASFRPSRQDPGLTLALAKQRRVKRGL